MQPSPSHLPCVAQRSADTGATTLAAAGTLCHATRRRAQRARRDLGNVQRNVAVRESGPGAGSGA